MNALLRGIIRECYHSLSSMNAFPFHRVDFHLLVTVFAGWIHSLSFYPN